MYTKITLDARLADYLELDITRNIEAIDFTVECSPSLKSVTTYTDRGKKSNTLYTDRNTGELVVKKEFIEDYENFILRIEFTWYDRNGEKFATKTKLFDMPDEGQWAARFRRQRERIMDDLKGRAKKYNATHYIDILYAFFKDEKQDFVETGSLAFANAIQATLEIDEATSPENKRGNIKIVQDILNNSLDGENKVHETLIYLTTLP